MSPAVSDALGGIFVALVFFVSYRYMRPAMGLLRDITGLKASDEYVDRVARFSRVTIVFLGVFVLLAAVATTYD